MIVDILLTLIIPIALIGIILYGNKSIIDDSYFMTKNYGDIMKGLCAIIVVLFHVPFSYQNPIQHFLGGFAFVAVTLFFLFSSFGMQLNVEQNPSYLSLFWKKRLLGLLCPVLVVNGSFCLLKFIVLKRFNFEMLFHVDEYVLVLLQYCFYFYVVNYLYMKKVLLYYWYKDVLLIMGVAISSLFVLLNLQSNVPSGENYWYVERYGLIWGLLLYRFFPYLKKWLNSSHRQKTTLAFVVSVLLLITYHSYKQYTLCYRYIFEILSAFFIILFLFLLSQKRMFGNNVCFFLGGISYEIYLSHRYVMEIMIIFFPELSNGVFIISVILMTILFSFVTHLLCTKLLHHFL